MDKTPEQIIGDYVADCYNVTDISAAIDGRRIVELLADFDYEIRPKAPAPEAATPPDTGEVGQPVNHEEAEQLAHLKVQESNLARCYLDLVASLRTPSHRPPAWMLTSSIGFGGGYRVGLSGTVSRR
jgi:hypothetical protein